MADSLLRSLRAGELSLLLQPAVRLSDMQAAGAEALLRWRHPLRGLLSELVDRAEYHLSRSDPDGAWRGLFGEIRKR